MTADFIFSFFFFCFSYFSLSCFILRYRVCFYCILHCFKYSILFFVYFYIVLGLYFFWCNVHCLGRDVLILRLTMFADPSL